MSHKIIRDSVHGYITLDDMFTGIVNSAEFQRLKSVEQGSFRVLYPAARHDRFIHSLGTYYLARKFSEHFVINIKEDLGISISQIELDKIQNTFYYASLLHDIGHAPFSHTTEKFFKRKELLDGEYEFNKVAIYEDLIKAVKRVVDKDSLEYFIKEFSGCSPSPHEIMSATILINKADEFLGANKDRVYLELAARMVIGCTYDYNSYLLENGDDKNILGIKNCFIRLLNSSTVDVDKMDYITRDTRMSGFDNVPIDIERLVKSVTAIKEKDGWIYPAFRKNALSVIDNVFRAKIEQSLWMVSHPVVLYDSELLSFCINSLNKCIGEEYIEKVFSLEALGSKGIEYENKTYRLLSDIDINSDLKKCCLGNELMSELYERGLRRHPIWKSYYEYKYLFNDGKSGEENIFLYFKGLIDYMKTNDSFVLDKKLYTNLKKKAPPAVKEAAKFLWKFCNENEIEFNFVILSSSNTFAPSFDPERVFISFGSLPCRDKNNYVTYKFLKGDIRDSESKRFFYIYSKEKFSVEQIEKLKDGLIKKIKENKKKEVKNKEKIKERV